MGADDWEKLKAEIAARKAVWRLTCRRVGSWRRANGDDFTARMFDAINGMLLDMLAAIARKDYEDHQRERQAQGIEKAKSAQKYPRPRRGRQAQRGHREDVGGQANLVRRYRTATVSQ